MKTILRHIASIQTGIFAKPIAEGKIVYLQAKHFDVNGNLINSIYPDLIAEGISDKHFLLPNDVLFAAKGTKNFASWYDCKNQQAVASTSFFVIRLHVVFHNRILPEFLAWFINQPHSQKYLKGNAIGTSIVSISKAVLEELEVLVPDIQTQQAILKISELQNKEVELKKQIEILREKQIQQHIINALKITKNG